MSLFILVKWKLVAQLLLNVSVRQRLFSHLKSRSLSLGNRVKEQVFLFLSYSSTDHCAGINPPEGLYRVLLQREDVCRHDVQFSVMCDVSSWRSDSSPRGLTVGNPRTESDDTSSPPVETLHRGRLVSVGAFRARRQRP